MPAPEPPETIRKGGTGLRFPQHYAFVLQFAAEAGPRSGLFRGRVEHVTTGEQVTFQSTEELWAFVRSVLLRAAAGPETLPGGRCEDR